MEKGTHSVCQLDTLEAWRLALAEVPQTPALTVAFVQRGPDLFGRFSACYQRLRSRPRAERRRLQRRLGLGLAGIALLLALNGGSTSARPGGYDRCRSRDLHPGRRHHRRQRRHRPPAAALPARPAPTLSISKPMSA